MFDRLRKKRAIRQKATHLAGWTFARSHLLWTEAKTMMVLFLVVPWGMMPAVYYLVLLINGEVGSLGSIACACLSLFGLVAVLALLERVHRAERDARHSYKQADANRKLLTVKLTNALTHNNDAGFGLSIPEQLDSAGNLSLLE